MAHIMVVGPVGVRKSTLLNDYWKAAGGVGRPFKESAAVDYDGTEKVTSHSIKGYYLYDSPGLDSDNIDTFKSQLHSALTSNEALHAVVLLVLGVDFLRFPSWVNKLTGIYSSMFVARERNVVVVWRNPRTDEYKKAVAASLKERGITCTGHMDYDTVRSTVDWSSHRSRMIVAGSRTGVNGTVAGAKAAVAKHQSVGMVPKSSPVPSNARHILRPIKNYRDWHDDKHHPAIDKQAMTRALNTVVDLMGAPDNRYDMECFMGDTILKVQGAIHIRGLIVDHGAKGLSCEDMVKCHVRKTQEGNDKKPGPYVIAYERYMKPILHTLVEKRPGITLSTDHHGKADFFEAVVSITSTESCPADWARLHRALVLVSYVEGDKILRERLKESNA